MASIEQTTTLTIIGCGKVGRTLGRLWAVQPAVVIQDILNTTSASGQRAVEFIGAGSVAAGYAALRPADVILIAAPDDRIEACADALPASDCIKPHSIVFHCSGALPSTILQAVAAKGAALASIHPIRSFAQPEAVAANFAGTFCGVEGDARAIAQLQPLFALLGARFVPIERDAKTLYHAAAVFASNYLVTLLDTAVQAYGQAGVPPDVAIHMMAALVRETTSNVLQLGPEQALTGPIARGDIATVERQYRAVDGWRSDYGMLYKQFWELTTLLAQRRGGAISSRADTDAPG